ncbi:MAG: hypothetical protein JWP01_2587 [Myxococcales bacterium]|nr:hypothetical protein [Myxococcales bacterium]
MTRMMNTYVVGLTLAAVSGCVSLTQRGTTGSSSASESTATEKAAYEPAMLELDTVKDSEGQWHLLIAGGMHAEGDAPRSKVAFTRAGETDRWKNLYTWKQFHDGITVFGGAQVASERGILQAREIDRLPVITSAGTYALKLDLGGTLVTMPVEIVETRVTNGQLGYTVATTEGKAALRFDRDVHGIDIGYPHEPRLWITLTTPMTRERTRADFLWYRGDAFVGQSSHQQHLGGIGIETPFEKQIRFWSWPKGVSFEEMENGGYTVYVYQDGLYTTACGFEVAGGNVTTRTKSSAPLACAKRETPLDVKSRGAKLEHNAEDPMRKKELVALFKSEETRKVLAGLVELRRSRGDSMMSRGMAAVDEEKAWTQHQANRAVQRRDAANADVNAIGKDIAKVEKRYAALVNKHGRE